MKNKLSILVTLLYLSSCSLGTNNRGEAIDLTVSINDSLIGVAVDVKEKIRFAEVPDTIRVSLENTTFLNYAQSDDGNYFMTRNLRVTSSGDSLDYAFDGVALSIPNHHGLKEVAISYEVPSYALFSLLDTCSYESLLLMNGDWSSWYFTTDNSVVQDIRFNKTSESKLFFDGTVLLGIDSSKYEKRLICTGRNTVTRYSRIQPTSISSKDSLLTFWISCLEDYFPKSKGMDIIVIDNNTGIGDYTFGQTLRISEHERCILADTSSYSNGVIMHELTHCFVPENIAEAPGKYVLSESLIEYLSRYIPNRRASNLDSLFNLGYQQEVSRSLLVIESNRSGSNGAENTSRLIYEVGPNRIHRFVKEIGFDAFDKIIYDYVKQCKKRDGNFTLEDFHKITARHGVSEEVWIRFYESL